MPRRWCRRAAPPGPTPTESLRAREATLLLLDLLARQLDAGEPPAPQTGVVPLPLAEAVTERLQRWHRRVLRTAKRYASIDDAERHRLRRRAKRLRYAAEFAASLFEPKDVARYLARLEPVQDCLGRYNDLCVGLATYRGTVGDDPRAWFAIGWLTARREVLLAEGAAALERFGRGKPFWRGR